MAENTQIPTVDEFDAWTDEAEEKAIAETATQTRVRHIIKNGEYWALAPGGTIYKLPLFLSIKDFEALAGAADDSQSIEQVKRILTVFAGEDQAKRLESEPMQVAFNLLQDYGATLSRTQGVDGLGKSPVSARHSAPTAE